MKDKKRCPNCSSTQIYHRLKTHDYMCYKCGRDFKEEKKEVSE